MQKVDGVSSVRVSLNEGLTVLELTPGNAVTLVRVREILRNNGYPTRDALVEVVGSVVSSAGAPVFEVAGTKERFPLVVSRPDQRQQAEELRAKAGPWLVTGTVDTRDPKSMPMVVTKAAAP